MYDEYSFVLNGQEKLNLQSFNQTERNLCQITEEKALASSINKNEHILQLLKQAYIDLFSDNVLLKKKYNIYQTLLVQAEKYTINLSNKK